MFNNYYDSVKLTSSSTGYDDAGYPIQSSPVSVNMRYVNGGKEFVIDREGTSIKYTKIYHSPTEVSVNDLIDGHIVVDVEPSRDVFGVLQFYIVRVK